MKHKLFLLLSLFFITHYASAQIQFGIGGGGSAGVGDLSSFLRGYNAYIELSYNVTDKVDVVLLGQVNALASIPIDNSLSQGWYQVPIMLEGRYFIIPKEAKTTFHPYVQAGVGGVKSYYLKTNSNNYKFEVQDEFWNFGARGGVGATVAMFNIQMNYNYGGSYKGSTLSVMDISIGFLF